MSTVTAAPFAIRSLDVLVETDAHEGPVYVPGEDVLYFTGLPRLSDYGAHVAIRRLDLADGALSVVHEGPQGANGMTLDADGRRLLVCEQGSNADPARVARLDPATGDTETVVDGWAGLPLNSPNDVVVKRDGTVWFTDPAYGHLQGFRGTPQLGDFVYRHDPISGETTVVADGFDKPNGLCFSPDESVLYVNDSGVNQEAGSHHPGRPHHVKAFDVEDGRRLRGERLFAVIAPGQPDGMKCDADGRVYVSSASGVQVFSPQGDRVGEIPVPGAVNFCFGGPERDVLYITNDTAVWAAVLEAKGA